MTRQMLNGIRAPIPTKRKGKEQNQDCCTES